MPAGAVAGVPLSQRDQRAYINETESRWIRARSPRFPHVNPYAAGAVRNRVAYTVGSGHTYNVVRGPNAT